MFFKKAKRINELEAENTKMRARLNKIDGLHIGHAMSVEDCLDKMSLANGRIWELSQNNSYLKDDCNRMQKQIDMLYEKNKELANINIKLMMQSAKERTIYAERNTQKFIDSGMANLEEQTSEKTTISYDTERNNLQ